MLIRTNAVTIKSAAGASETARKLPPFEPRRPMSSTGKPALSAPRVVGNDRLIGGDRFRLVGKGGHVENRDQAEYR